MKSISCTIWILGALLVMAALDTLPDPPAVNPSAAAGKILSLQDTSCDTAMRRCDSVVVPDLLPVILVAEDTGHSNRFADQVVLTRQAADSSPPATQVARPQSFQSK
jgi:hypothetical protein